MQDNSTAGPQDGVLIRGRNIKDASLTLTTESWFEGPAVHPHNVLLRLVHRKSLEVSFMSDPSSPRPDPNGAQQG
jgi:hypothetical protein